MGARDLRPPWFMFYKLLTFSLFYIFLFGCKFEVWRKKRHLIFFFQVGFFLFFTLYFLLPWTPCPAPTLPIPLPSCPVSNFPFAARDKRRKLHKELFFLLQVPLLLRGTGGGSYIGNFFPFAAKDFFGIWVSGPGRTDRQ